MPEAGGFHPPPGSRGLETAHLAPTLIPLRASTIAGVARLDKVYRRHLARVNAALLGAARRALHFVGERRNGAVARDREQYRPLDATLLK